MSASAQQDLGIAQLKFQATFTDVLPADLVTGNETRQVHSAAFSRVKPTNPATDDVSAVWKDALQNSQVRSGERGEPVLDKALIVWSESTAQLFDLPPQIPNSEEEKSIIEVLGGFGTLWPGMDPYAACYGGHQFGNWAGQLGDGRAISMGEYVNNAGERWEIQLKGAGKTPYSRFADGRAVLRSSVREFLCSESMFHLGVPTTRALSLVGTGAGVIRDMFYEGSPQMEPGAVVARVAPSFLRLGNFQLPMSRNDVSLLKAIADYAIEYHFPQFNDMPTEIDPKNLNKYQAFVEQVVRANAKMVAMWQGVGFVHGVMNTDNFSILGLTIDYGPYGYLDTYDPEYTPNTTDLPGKRYKFESQPNVAHWNILQFAKAMVPLCGADQMQRTVLEFESIFKKEYNEVMSKKLGLQNIDSDEDQSLLEEFLNSMAHSKGDHTNTWRALAKISASSSPAECLEWCNALSLCDGEASSDLWSAWLAKYVERLNVEELDDEDRVKIMNKANPVYILRNYMAQAAIELAEKGDYSEVRKLHELLKRPFEEQEGMEGYTKRPPTWAGKRGVSVNSCSS